MLILLLLIIQSLDQSSIFFLLSFSLTLQFTQVIIESILFCSIVKFLSMFLAVNQFLFSLVDPVLILKVNDLILDFLREVFLLLDTLNNLNHLLSDVELGFTNFTYFPSLLNTILIHSREWEFLIDTVLATLLSAKLTHILLYFQGQSISAAKAWEIVNGN